MGAVNSRKIAWGWGLAYVAIFALALLYLRLLWDFLSAGSFDARSAPGEVPSQAESFR